MKLMQDPAGFWKGVDGRRPPMNAGTMQATALAIYTLKTFTPPNGKADTAARLARAAVWLQKATPQTTQDRAFHLLALHYSDASRDAISSAAAALAATQHPAMGVAPMPPAKPSTPCKPPAKCQSPPPCTRWGSTSF